MSTWTNERHEEARSIGFGFSFYEPGICELVADAVTEIERLRAESARRMVWLEREQKAHEQTRLALVDMTERAAHPQITDTKEEA